ncbi:LysR family transcriptional regulator [Pseudoalteromonas luteoviolacea]|uniref:LysR family transcriptional regulator n=1 Tax=Pseudoalteromonas luteoviolacea TaxID=43657 RepID=A0A1C0TWN9_9GAMM|nr:LysR family transcriptional regulator [Pseudoalteromonas luteoviolacea]OCQ23731.1 LysR family transcriptional regulator [Pseudoalteromonas luteoviolacea]
MLPSQLPMFIAAAKEGSFSGAGRKLGVSASAVSKSISALEMQTGTRLFHRSTRQFSLTEDGQILFQKISPLLLEIDNSIESISQQNQQAKGKLKINLPDSFGREFVLPHLTTFLQAHEGIELDLVFDDRTLNIVEEGFDIGIGNKINEDSRLIARRLYTMQSGIFATRKYCEKFGVPASLEDLSLHNCVVYSPLGQGQRFTWPLLNDAKELIRIEPKGNLTVSSISAAKAAMLQHLGLTYMGRWHIESELSTGEVIPILPHHWSTPSTVWLYYSSKAHLPKRTRLLIDYLVDNIAQNAS